MAIPPHDVLRIYEFLAEKSTTKMDHPSYSPDITLMIFGSFQNLKCPAETKIC
jgi:hypothetical protein